MVNGDIPRAEVERVLEELRRIEASEIQNNTMHAWAYRDAINRIAALLKPKQYKVEWWVGICKEGSVWTFSHKPNQDYISSNLAAFRHYTDTLEHGEGIE